VAAAWLVAARVIVVAVVVVRGPPTLVVWPTR
jgi:hypothetical protein